MILCAYVCFSQTLKRELRAVEDLVDSLQAVNVLAVCLAHFFGAKESSLQTGAFHLVMQLPVGPSKLEGKLVPKIVSLDG